MRAAFAAYAAKRWLFILMQGIVAVTAVTVVSAMSTSTSYDYTAHFVLRPSSTAPRTEVANLASQLTADGPIVQTVLHVLSSPELLHRAATASHADGRHATLSASVRPGSAFFDETVRAPSAASSHALGRAVVLVASTYVETSYRDYAFAPLGEDTTRHSTFPPASAALLLAFVLGVVAAIAELFAWFAYRALREPESGDRDEPGDDADDHAGDAVELLAVPSESRAR
jgi:capsular polysaccharide biosynthesis protein